MKPARRTDDQTAEGPTDGPSRLCVATREVKPLDELIRFVVGPGDRLTPDLKRNLPGRGVWVTASRKAIADALKKKAFARSLKAPVVAPPDLADEVEALLARSARESFSLANKAGLVVSGFSKVEAAAGSGGIAAVLHARDAAPDGVRKIGQALRRRHGENAEQIPVLTALESAELDLALGRSHVIHAALMKGPASRNSVARFRALERYRDGTPATAAGAGQPTDMTTMEDPRTEKWPEHDRPIAERQDNERND